MTNPTSDDAAIAAMAQALAGGPERDGLERVQYRMRIVLAGAYDLEHNHGEPETSVIDLLTDVLHYCEANNLDVDYVLDKATQMQHIEKEDWS